MADQTISARGNSVLIAPGAPGYKEAVTVGDADEKPGMAVTGVGETHPEVDLRASTEALFGILLNRADVDIDTAFTAAQGADGVTMARYKSGARVYTFMQANASTCTAGQPLKGGSEDGKFTTWAAAMPGSDTYATATAQAAETVLANGLVYICEDYTQDASNDKVVEVIL